MPQLSLYIDEKTLKNVEKAAKTEHVSISKWVCGKLKKSFNEDWPENYFNLFGSISDDSFSRPKQCSKFSSEPREEF